MNGEVLLELRLPARAESLRGLRERLGAVLAEAGCDGRTAAALVLAVNEACMNVIQHAYRHEPGEVTLTVCRRAGSLEFRLRDYAECVDIGRIRPRPLDEVRPGGLGTHFIREIMDEFDYAHAEDGSGNVLTMRKHLTPGGP